MFGVFELIASVDRGQAPSEISDVPLSQPPHLLATDVCLLQPVRTMECNRIDANDQGHCSGKTRTFKPRKDAPEGTKQYQLRKYAEATLVRDIQMEPS